MISVYCFTKKNIHEAGALPHHQSLIRTSLNFAQFALSVALQGTQNPRNSRAGGSWKPPQAGGVVGGMQLSSIVFRSMTMMPNFPLDEMYESDYSQGSECSEDSDSPIGTQVPVDYDQLELLHHHRRGHEERGSQWMSSQQGRGSSVSLQQGDQVPVACGAPGSGRQMGSTGRGRGGGTSRRSSVRLYTNPENVGARRGGL